MTERQGDWMQTFTGRQFWPLDPRPEDVCIEDIAHQLSMVCRFGGAVREFYSVAQHSWFVSELLPPRLAPWGLFHDAHEAYTGDMIAPLRRSLRAHTEAYEAIARQVQGVIECKFKLHGLNTSDAEQVRHADLVARATERRDLMATTALAWPGMEDIDPDEEPVVAYRPETAEQLFIERFRKLAGRMGAR